jgi:hypothetical protein
MPGSLRKRGNSWELRAYAGTDPETGKPLGQRDHERKPARRPARACRARFAH